MTWYKLVFKQNQPIHIGSINWGVINQTLIFIPGWTMWGALTKAYNIHKMQSFSENQQLFETITCFYPSFDKNDNNILFPNYKNGVFSLGDFSEDKFRYKFTDTFVSTAILPESRGAKEESLHEIEALLPKEKEALLPKEKKKSGELYWIGLLGINHDDVSKVSKDFLKEGLRIYIGGDTRYGLGELELSFKNEVSNNDLKKWQLTVDAMLDNSSLNEGFKNFLEFSTDLNFQGEFILQAEFSFLQNKPKVKEATYLITPGSKLDGNLNSKSYRLIKGKFIKQGG
jgi:hypothetical protein